MVFSQAGVLNNGNFQTFFPDSPKPARVGQFLEIIQTRVGINIASDLPQIATIAFSTASGNHTVTIDGVAVTFTTGASDAATAAAGATAINGTYSVSGGSGVPPATRIFSGRVVASAASGVLTITGRVPGDAFPITYTGTGGTLRVDGSSGSQVAVVSSPIQYGRFVGYNTNDSFGDRTAFPIRYPNGAGTLIQGISGGSIVRPYSTASVYSYFRGESVAYLTKGTAVVELDSTATAPAVGGSVFSRHTADGVLTKLGAAATASGTGLASVSNAVFASRAFVTEGIPCALIRVNLV